MSQPSLSSRIPARFEVGAKVSFSRTFTEADMVLFIGVTWDVNPFHTDDQFAARTKFGRRVLPGLLTASMATHLGGLWGFLAQEMHMEFLAPVYVGDTITLEGEVVEVEPRGRVQRENVLHQRRGGRSPAGRVLRLSVARTAVG